MIMFKFLKGNKYSPSLIEHALQKGEIAEIRMDKDYVYIATDIKGLENEVELLTSINITKSVESMLVKHRCLNQVLHDIEQAHNKIITTAYTKFKKYGLDLIDFVIIEGE